MKLFFEWIEFEILRGLNDLINVIDLYSHFRYHVRVHDRFSDGIAKKRFSIQSRKRNLKHLEAAVEHISMLLLLQSLRQELMNLSNINKILQYLGFLLHTLVMINCRRLSLTKIVRDQVVKIL